MFLGWIAEGFDRYFRSCPDSDYVGPKVIDLYRRFGVLPIGDTGRPGGGSWGFRYHKDRRTERRWKEDPRRWFNRYFTQGLKNVARIQEVASDRGIFGHKTRKLPDPVLAFLLRDRVAPVELELSAYEGGRREQLLELILMNPWTRDGDQAVGLLEEILALPYREATRRHYQR